MYRARREGHNILYLQGQECCGEVVVLLHLYSSFGLRLGAKQIRVSRKLLRRPNITNILRI